MIMTEEDRRVRPCLRCNKGFLTDRWHRICKRCHRRIRRENIGRLAIAARVSLDKMFKNSVLSPGGDDRFNRPNRYSE